MRPSSRYALHARDAMRGATRSCTERFRHAAGEPICQRSFFRTQIVKHKVEWTRGPSFWWCSPVIGLHSQIANQGNNNSNCWPNVQGWTNGRSRLRQQPRVSEFLEDLPKQAKGTA